MTLKHSRALPLGALTLVASLTAQAQIIDPAGSGIVYFDIKVHSTVIGQVVVVDHDATAPAGFESGQEYWHWDPTQGPAWRGAFRLEPRPGNTGAAFDDLSWEVYDLDHFDLNVAVPMPSVALEPVDGFYEVIEVDESTQPPTLETVAYFWLNDTGGDKEQIWYGIDGTLTNDRVGLGADHIRFRSMDEPPAVGSIDVNLLCDGTCP